MIPSPIKMLRYLFFAEEALSTRIVMTAFMSTMLYYLPLAFVWVVFARWLIDDPYRNWGDKILSAPFIAVEKTGIYFFGQDRFGMMMGELIGGMLLLGFIVFIGIVIPGAIIRFFFRLFGIGGR